MSFVIAPPQLATARLSDFAAACDGAAIPEVLLARMEECLLDFAGVASHAARFAEGGKAFLAGARSLDPHGTGFTVLGEAGRHSQAQAALLNGAFAHATGFDDAHPAAGVHPGAVVIAAALGWAERVQPTGQALLEALAIGYEVTCRIGAALTRRVTERGFDVTPLAGVFGAVAAGARLRGLDAPALESAFGLAGSLAAGTLQAGESGAWNQRLHPGFAAHAALTALSFAESGVVAASEPLLGRFGLLATTTDRSNPDVLTQGLGTAWLGAGTVIQPYPSLRATHSAIEAALALRATAPADGFGQTRLRLALAPEAFALLGEPLESRITPKRLTEAQASVHFQVACAWLDGKVDWQSYERIGCENAEAIAAGVEVEVDPALPPLGCRLALYEAPQFVVEVREPPGEASAPLGRPRIRAKFLDLAVPVFGRPRSEALAARLLAMREEPSAAAVIQGMRLFV